jgi:hypothetical protein
VPEPQTARNVSFPPGETTYREFFYRHTYADGTTRDTEPRKVGESTPGSVVDKVIAGIREAATARSAIRMERTVTVTATEWSEVIPQPLVDEAKVAEAVTPQTGDPNDYCQRTRCGHARGFHSSAAVGTGDGGPDSACGRCDNPDMCSSFIAKRVLADG